MAKIPSKAQAKSAHKTQEQSSLGHLNHMSGVSYDVMDPIKTLRMVAASCFFGEPQYYAESGNMHDKARAPRETARTLSKSTYEHLDKTLGTGLSSPTWHGLSTATMMEQVIDAALDHDPRATLEEAARLRQEDHMRTTPQVIMVRAANHPKVRATGLVREYAPKILGRADEPVVQLAYHDAVYGTAIPNALKKAWRTFLATQTPTQLAKYRLENKSKTLKTVIKLCKPTGDVFQDILHDRLKLDTRDTWEAMLSSEGASKETWTKAVDVMGHMALLRNLRNFHQHGVDPKDYVPKLVATAAKGKQLPFRYFSAYQQVKAADGRALVLDAVEECMTRAVGELPHFKGRVMSLCDNSGSARGSMTSSMGTMKVANIANLTAVLTGMAADEGHVGVFGDTLKTFEVRKKASILDQVQAADRLGDTVGGGTENGIWLFFKNALQAKEHWDHIFVYSDMQAGHGGLYGTRPSDYAQFRWANSSQHIDVAALIKAYREQVNPNVHVYLVQVAGYKDTLAPEFYDKTYILGGWGEGLLKFAHSMSQLSTPTVTTGANVNAKAPATEPAPVVVAKAKPAVKKRTGLKVSVSAPKTAPSADTDEFGM